MNQGFDDSMKLGHVIQELRASEKAGDMTNQMSAEIMQVFEQHDAVHVLFNCGTSLEDEIAAHVWMVFATTANVNEMHHTVATQQHRSVLSGIGHLKLLITWLACLPRILHIIYKSLHMKKKVAVGELSQLKEQSIHTIRQEHGIVL